MALHLNSVPTWTKFFIEAGIPSAEAKQYAKTFVENRLSEQVLAELTIEHLKAVNIHVLGDTLAILRHAKKIMQEVPCSSSLTEPSSSHYKPPAAIAKLPSLSTDMTHPQFRKFRIDWDVYKRITNLPQAHITTHLYSACTEEVQNGLISTNPDCLALPETVFLKLIEQLVTKRVNPAVHRMNFQKVMQQETESIQEFVVRLRSAAVDCEFECPSCQADIAHVSIKDQFISGLHNEVLQTDILAKANQLKSLEDVVKHAEAFEGAVRDQADLQSSSPNHVARISEYQRNRRTSTLKQTTHNTKPQACSGCGSHSHGTRGSHNRATECPAWGKICNSCQRPNHFAAVCRQSASANSVLIAHVHYDPSKDQFTGSRNCIQEIPANISPIVGTIKHSPTTMNIFPDSGANICLAGTRHLRQLQIEPSDLQPCRKRVTAVGGSVLVCKGWIDADIEVEGNHTTQQLYFCDKVDRIYFSKQGCLEAKILPPSFPHPMTSHSVSSLLTTDELKANTINKNSTEDSAHPPPHSNKEIQQRPLPPPRPAKLPYPPTRENIPKLEAYILEQFASTAFNNSAPFPAMNSPPAKIHLKPDAVPYARHTPIPVPHHWKEEVKADLDRDVQRDILAPVPIGTPVTWCSPMVIVTKKNGAPRRTIDFQKLNSQCLRETHHTQSPFSLVSQIPENSFKTVIDAVDGYHAVELDKDSQGYTTFITEWGRYLYQRMPQGFLAAGDAYTRRYDEIIKDVPRKVKIVDDALLHDPSIESAFYHTWDYLSLMATNGIVANAAKFQFCRETVDFAGFTVTPTGPAPSPRILSAIKDFPVPKDLTGARSWFGLVNQVAWAYSLSPVMEPFRELIKPNRKFYWDENLTMIFENSKDKIISLVKEGIRTFDASRKTCLQTDWSREGIGYLLLQKHCKCTDDSPVCCQDGWQLIYAGSRFLSPAESRYTPTEGEALAVAWSLQHSRMFTLGCKDLLICVDHKPLLGIFNDRELDNVANPRLQDLKEFTLRWRYRIVFCPGKWHRGPDAVSRHPTNPGLSEGFSIASLFADPSPTSSTLRHNFDESQQLPCIYAIQDLDSSVTLDNIRDSAQTDNEYQDLIEFIQKGYPERRNQVEPPHNRSFWEVRHRLTVADGIVLMDQRIVIPKLLRKQILGHLHRANQGVSGMTSRASQTVYWPGIDTQIRNYKDTCADCLKHAPSQPAEPLVLTPSPEWPFQQICMDYFELNAHAYLSIVDRFSGWICIYSFSIGQATSEKLITICRDLFTSYGAAEEISSDGGPQLTATKFEQFLAAWGVKHRTSSVSYPQSNGRAELGVKAAKRIIHNNLSPNGSLNNDSAARAILQYRNTPLPYINLSPAQILLHRQLRDSLPSHPSHYQLHKDWVISAKEREAALAKRNHIIVERYNGRTRELPPLLVGTKVAVQEEQLGKKYWNKTGTIIEALDHRQYRIRMDASGRITLRNRRFLRNFTPISSPMPPTPPSDVVSDQLRTTTLQPSRKTPRALKALQSYNRPGLKEQ